MERKRFDFFLVEQALKAGARVHNEKKILGIEVLPDRPHIVTDYGSFADQIVVGADGANSVVARLLDFDAK